jgi:glutathionyl-hydroquinone reductase
MALGMLVNGKWITERNDQDRNGKFHEKPTTFRDRVTTDGSSGFKAEAGRYHLYVALACPWAHRTLIMRELKGLNDTVSVAIADVILGNRGWSFSQAIEAMPDNPIQYLQEIYLKADPQFTGRVTVPVLWDKQKQTIVNNDSLEIMRMLDVEFEAFSTQTINFYPHNLREKIDRSIDSIYLPINIGVYRAGFATSQVAYEEAVAQLFEHLDRWERVLSQQRYLCGVGEASPKETRLTEADICLFTTLYRFDSVYYSHFKCNLRRIVDYPNLWNYLKDLYQRPEFKATCNQDMIKRGYYLNMADINPNQIVPKGPIVNFNEPHDRDALSRFL